MLFALLGISLGLKPARGGHSERFGVSVALFFFYYSLMRVGETLAQRGKLNAFVAMSIPDIVFMVLAFWFFYRSAIRQRRPGPRPRRHHLGSGRALRAQQAGRVRFRPRLSPVMDRFIAGQFFGPFMVCLAAFTAAYLLGDMFDRFDDLIRYGGLGLLGLEYFALKLPLIISQVLPVACLAGVLLGFALLNRSGEVLACQQLGISRLEMAVPVLLVAVLISGFDFLISETVVPAATREAKYIYAVELKKARPESGVCQPAHLGARARRIYFGRQLRQERRAPHRHHALPTRRHLRAPGPAACDECANGTATTGSRSDSNSMQIADGGTVTKTGTNRLELGLTPADFGLLRFDPEEFSLWELDRYIADLRSKGLDPGGYVVDRDLKYAMPLACLIMAALGMALSLDPLPRNLSLGRSFGLAIVDRFCLLDFARYHSALGRSGLLPAAVAAWVPNFMFSMIAISIFLFGEER